jgi:circadian clock protein KaiB
VTRPAARARFVFRLFTAGNTRNSAQALANLSALCRAHLRDRFEIEVVDVLRHPERALAERIFMTPTLIALSPRPACRIVGTLTDEAAVLRALGLESCAA